MREDLRAALVLLDFASTLPFVGVATVEWWRRRVQMVLGEDIPAVTGPVSTPLGDMESFYDDEFPKLAALLLSRSAPVHAYEQRARVFGEQMEKLRQMAIIQGGRSAVGLSVARGEAIAFALIHAARHVPPEDPCTPEPLDGFNFSP